ncbi:MAG: carboxy-S-adenosyl-L-methionine synthase CmoA, partial [Luminiphilus sp.]|nr:carboxy-S-adenosyl-L-methionine synthase CmoA [Luminiphilus sp.]
MTTNRDTIYAQTLGDPGLFTFNKDVVGVFPDMINRSVPGYATVISMTGLLAARYARTGTRIYDLGCSLGASLLSAARQPNCQTNT